MAKNLGAQQGVPGLEPGGRAASSSSAPAVDLVLQSARTALGHSAGHADARGFLVRRARSEIHSLPSVPERGCLLRILDAVEASAPAEALAALVEVAGYLESGNRLGEAERMLELAMELDPSDPELRLHAARVARKSGRDDLARRLYDRVRGLDGVNGHLARMAELGHALLAADPEPALGPIIRRALGAGDSLTAAVAQEERARARRAKGDVAGALRDYAISAARFSDPADLGRIGHEAADLLVLSGHLMAARRALLEVERRALPRQAERARARLYDLSRALGDEVGQKRWADSAPPSLVSLSPPLRRSRARRAQAARLEEMIRRLQDAERTGS